MNIVSVRLGIALSLVMATSAAAQQAPAAAAQGGADLAKQLSNPISSLVSVPFQLNWDGGVGPGDQTRFLLNFQPVMPFRLTEKVNLIARVIVPVLSQPPLVTGGTANFGFSDIFFSAFLSPAQPKGFIWGIGPAFSLPTTANPFLGSEKWSAGPTVVMLKQAGPLTLGFLGNHVWSFAGTSSRADVNQTFLQPFVSYTTKSAVTYGLNTEASANWEAASGQQWTVPINVSVSKVVKIGRRPSSIGVGAGYYVETPNGGPEWKFRTVITLLFPK